MMTEQEILTLLDDLEDQAQDMTQTVEYYIEQVQELREANEKTK